MMRFIRLYTRVLGLLGPQAKLGVVLALANILLAVAAFAEPILFGRIIDSLISISTGFPLNAVSNTLLTVGYLIPVLATGALKARFDLLAAAGAANARLFICAVDDPEPLRTASREQTHAPSDGDGGGQHQRAEREPPSRARRDAHLRPCAAAGSGWRCPSARRPAPAGRHRTGPPAR